MKEDKCGLCPEALSGEGQGIQSKDHLGRVNLIKDLGPGGGGCCGGLAQSGRGRQSDWTFELRGEGESQPARQRGLRGD